MLNAPKLNLSCFFALTISLITLSACSVKTPDDYDSPKELFNKAQALFDKKNFSEAALHFENLENRFPESSYASQAALLKCDAYYNNRDYLEAEYAYSQFKKFYPKHEKIAYVTLRIGLSQLKQANKVASRDQSYTQSSISYFNEVIRLYPGTEAAKEALTYSKQAKKKIYEKELYVGNFYIKQKQYTSAINRLEPLLDNYSYPELHQKAQYKTALAYYRLKNYDECQRVLNLEIDTQTKTKYLHKMSALKKKLAHRSQK
ncbi:MAG TPA: outer membrane protein assembly factor BamD [Oligoflexia bacterium]|nr:outer membrane protein assembly factor BamD [Oligoflexia bacterium]HMR24494.1 outer membrane protein assembly factor BamD [Oligoflexia bacterium]